MKNPKTKTLKKCSKKAYPTKGSAERALERIETSEEHRLKTPCRYYFCDDCSKYHLTSIEVFNHKPTDLKFVSEWELLVNKTE